ncbi:MAG: hypothetical protein GY866_13755 [Proteobacteria bacterium]|nr:hypothetical protein [Pseudomonadota bacterium]
MCSNLAVDGDELPIVHSVSLIIKPFSDHVGVDFAHKNLQQGTKPDVYAQVLGNESIVGMVNLGFGVGVVPHLVIKNSPFADNVEVLSVADPLEPYRIGVCAARKKTGNPLIRAFWKVAVKRKIVR